MSDLKDLYGPDYFGDGAYGDDPRRAAAYAQEFARVTRHVDRGAVLDVGCGMGDFLALFPADRWTRHGIEISDHARAAAAARGVTLVDYDLADASLDLVIFRGTIQHLDEPFRAIRQCQRMLRPGGIMAFLATPNSNSPVYRLFRELPALDPPRNFLIPSDIMLGQALANLGMEVLGFEYPYRDSPYARPWRDHARFVLRFLGVRRPFAFWRNMMECYARKPGGPR